MKMKSLWAMLALVVSAPAMANEMADTARAIMMTQLQASIALDVHTNNLINWKVGEYQTYDITSSFGNMGAMKKYVASEVGNNIWVNSEMGGGMMGGSQKVEALIDRATGKILEMKQNGQRQAIPDDKIEVISQDSTSITVPAGTFECIHIVAKSQKISKLEVWANPRDITMDGSAQMYIESGFMPMTLKLTGMGGR